MTDPGTALPDDPDNSPVPEDSGLGHWATSTRRRTTDLLAIGLVVVLGLAIGRQVTSWWNEPGLGSETDTVQLTGQVAGPGTAWTEPEDLELGQLAPSDGHGSIRRRRITGDRDDAWTALESLARQTATTVGWPEKSPDAGESKLLAVLAQRGSATASNTSDTHVHRLDGPLPMVVTTRRLLGDTRVLSWGLATRRPDNTWVSWTFSASSTSATGDILLPRGATRLLAVGQADPDRLVVFAGQAAAGSWLAHFQATLLKDRWQPASVPGTHSEGWTGRWHHGDGRTLVVSVRHHPSGRSHGMLNVFTPSNGNASEGADEREDSGRTRGRATTRSQARQRESS